VATSAEDLSASVDDVSAVGSNALLTVNDVAANANDLSAAIGEASAVGNDGLLTFDDITATDGDGSLVPSVGDLGGSRDPLLTVDVTGAPIGDQHAEIGGSGNLLPGLG
jgi:hypothetical protein